LHGRRGFRRVHFLRHLLAQLLRAKVGAQHYEVRKGYVPRARHLANRNGGAVRANI
jgi:hypothetical protein